MNPTRTWWAVAIGICMVLFLAPQTSWVAKNLVDGVRYRNLEVSGDAYTSQAYAAPAYLLEPKLLTANTQNAKMARAILSKDSVSSFDVAMNNQSAAFFAYAIRNFGAGELASIGSDFRGKNSHTDGQVLGLVKTAIALDRDNAYFYLIEALANKSLNQPAAVLASIGKAAKASNFTDYLVDENTLLVSEIENQWGYRGDANRMAIMASIRVPELGPVSGLSNYVSNLPNSTAKLKARQDLIIASSKIGNKSSSLMGILTASNLANKASVENPLILRRIDSSRTKQLVTEGLAKLENDLKAAGQPKPLRPLNELVAELNSYVERGTQDVRGEDGVSVAHQDLLSKSSWSICAVVLLLMAVFFSKIREATALHPASIFAVAALGIAWVFAVVPGFQGLPGLLIVAALCSIIPHLVAFDPESRLHLGLSVVVATITAAFTWYEIDSLITPGYISALTRSIDIYLLLALTAGYAGLNWRRLSERATLARGLQGAGLALTLSVLALKSIAYFETDAIAAGATTCGAILTIFIFAATMFSGKWHKQWLAAYQLMILVGLAAIAMATKTEKAEQFMVPCVLFAGIWLISIPRFKLKVHSGMYALGMATCLLASFSITLRGNAVLRETNRYFQAYPDEIRSGEKR